MAQRSRVFAVVNQKGGVGKTTTAVNLAASFAVCERPTLLVDLDGQANATSAFGAVPADAGHVYHALLGRCEMKDALLTTELSHLHLLPSGRDLYGAEIELVETESREHHLERGLADLRDAYELILIDCPPSLGILTLNALCAADAVVIPLQAEYYALEGLAGLLETVDLVRQKLNPGLRLEGILLTMTDLRNTLSRQVESEVRGHFGEQVFRTMIPRNVRLSEAPSHGRPVVLYDAQSRGAVAYLQLAEEILERTGLKRAPVLPDSLRSDAPDGESPIGDPPQSAPLESETPVQSDTESGGGDG